MVHKRRLFRSEYQAEIVSLISDDGKAVSAVTRDLELTESAVRREGSPAKSMCPARVDDGRARGVITAAS